MGREEIIIIAVAVNTAVAAVGAIAAVFIYLT
jgi:hypothetical protein